MKINKFHKIPPDYLCGLNFPFTVLVKQYISQQKKSRKKYYFNVKRNLRNKLFSFHRFVLYCSMNETRLCRQVKDYE
ncbi:hypothetical protein DXA34_08745 [[Clostridium] symbiosum]|nr:hypothetical protein DXA34_08745 [[Clostridium] symbiosum]